MTTFGQTHQEPRRGFFFQFLAALLFAAGAQGLIYLLLLDHTVGLWVPKLAASIESSGRVIVLSKPESVPSERRTRHEIRVRQWTQVLASGGIPYEVVTSDMLSSALHRSDVLILPGAECLSMTERSQITDFLSLGNGVVASGPVGSRDENCSWAGWDFLQRITGSNEAYSVPMQGDGYITFAGERFFSDSVPTGHRPAIRRHHLTLLNANSPDASFTNWRFDTLQNPFGRGSAVAVHRGSFGGRVVWFGFEEDSILHEADTEVFAGYMASSVRWAGRQMIVAKANWPGARQSAAVFIQNVSRQATNTAATSALMEGLGMPATYFVSPAIANNVRITGPRASAEIALLNRLTFDRPMGTPDEMLLPDRRKVFQTLGNFVVDGVAPQNGLLDGNTPALLNRHQYKYFLDEISFDRAEPQIIEFPVSVFFPFQKSEVVRIPVAARKDFQTIAGYPQKEIESAGLALQFIDGLDRMSQIAGLHTFYFNDYLLGSPEHEATLREIAVGVKERDVWVSTAGDVAKWWSARHNLQVDARPIGLWRIELDITNLAEGQINDSAVRIYLPHHVTGAAITSSLAGAPRPQLQLQDNDVLLLRFNSLSGQTSYRFIISLRADVSN